MAETKVRKLWLIYAILVLAGIAAAFFGGIAFQLIRSTEPEPVITAEIIGQEIASISEYAALEYRYTNVGKFENQVEFYGWKVPLTTKSFIIIYDGVMKLGVVGSEIKIEVTGQEIRITLPEIKILSHELKEDSLEVLDQTHNIFNQLEIEDYTQFAVDQKQALEEKARISGLFTEAYERAEKQLGDFLRSLPVIRDEYTVVFVH